MNKPNHDFNEEAELTSSASVKRKENANPPPPPALPSSAVLKMGRQERNVGKKGQLVAPYFSPRKEAELLILSVFIVFMWH